MSEIERGSPFSVSSSSLEEELSVNPLSISPSSCLSSASSSFGASLSACLACGRAVSAQHVHNMNSQC